jgi:hypothetical protein
MAGWKDSHRRRPRSRPRKRQLSNFRAFRRAIWGDENPRKGKLERQQRTAELHAQKLERLFNLTPEQLERDRAWAREARWEREAVAREHAEALLMDDEWERTSSPPARRRRQRRRIVGLAVAAALFAGWWVAQEAKYDACRAGSACARHNLQEEERLDREYPDR